MLFIEQKSFTQIDYVADNPSNGNFYFMNDLCYTEDDMTVQDLYLYDIPTELKEEDMLEHFNRLGKVGRLQLSDNDRCSPGQTNSDSSGSLKTHQQEKEVKTGRVLFDNPLDAAKVLLNETHNVNGHQFHVTVSHSWLQPEANDILEPSSSQPEESHVMKVPDDCLIRILKLLPLSDQLRFLRYCSRFRDVLHLDTRTLHKSVVIDNLKSLSEWDIHLRGDLELPSTIETLCLSECKKVTPNNLIQMCKSLTNLKELDIRINESCDFKNDLCYTKDHIVVQDLYLYDVPTELKEEDMLEHFNRFGKVGRLQLSDNDRCSPGQTNSDSSGSLKTHQQEKEMKTGRVLFDNPLDAAKVLLNETHNVNGHQFHVMVSHSWLQPEANDILEPSSSQPEESHVMKVPDDCLIRILKLLPLSDQLRFLRYCSPFRDVLHLDTRTLHKNMQKMLFGSDCLEYLDIYGGNLYNDCLVVLKDLRKLKQLCIRDCNQLSEDLEKSELTDDSLAILQDLKELKILNLSRNHKLRGDLKLPTSIETLDLSGCAGILSRNYIRICKSLPNLKKLDISGNRYIPVNIYDYLLSIETFAFEIERETPYKKIAKLPNLKRIYIKEIRSSHVFEDLLSELVAEKSQQLEYFENDSCLEYYTEELLQLAKLTGLRELHFYGEDNIDDDILEKFSNFKELEVISFEGGYPISNAAILRLIAGCPKLRNLRFQECLDLTEDLVHRIIEDVEREIEKKVNQRQLPIDIYLKSCKIRKSINTHPDVVNNNILKTVIKN
ncbi:uncharacterized protein Dwil_GK23300 [Drosophila willistoni]|uniref:F-box domain-containing protein n=1 Tax=Drosophila willistoni TaxID=7260 RepID=A0A0Q9X6L6_DROWI|nr:uncharacterized protein Dwil_GK23300 [Drosophila willistoni]